MCVSAEDENELAEAIYNMSLKKGTDKKYSLFQDKFVKRDNVKSYIGALYI